jgi:hypothetical protein
VVRQAGTDAPGIGNKLPDVVPQKAGADAADLGNIITGCGEIGRRTRLRIWRSNPCRFDPYHPDNRISSKEQGMMNKELQNSIFLVPCSLLNTLVLN